MGAPRMLDALVAFVYSHNRHEAPKHTETPLQSHACGVSSCGAERRISFSNAMPQVSGGHLRGFADCGDVTWRFVLTWGESCPGPPQLFRRRTPHHRKNARRTSKYSVG